MDLFAALDYAGLENRTSMLLLAVLRHLSDTARAGLLRDVVPADLGATHEIRGQHTVSVGVLDGWLRWSGHCVVVMEAKVDDPLGREQPNRYAAWLSTQVESHRVLWLVTRDLPEVAALLPTLDIPANVKRVWTTWTQLADRAAELAPSAAEGDRLLLVALAQRLRAAGLAATPHLPIDGAALGLALGAFPHIRRLREHLVEWFRGSSWLPGTWTREARYETWVDLSVCAHHPLKLTKSDVEGKDRWITWWAEVYAPAKGESVWPPGQSVGVGLRLGVILQGAVTAEVVLDSLRAALGAPSAVNHPGFFAAEGYHPWIYDVGTYHEVWWRVEFDPIDFSRSAEHLRLAIDDQGRRLTPFVEGILNTAGERV